MATDRNGTTIALGASYVAGGKVVAIDGDNIVLDTERGQVICNAGDIVLVDDALAGTGGGTSDHGALTGLADDDHTHYYNQTRGDARYMRRANDLADVVDDQIARTNLLIPGGFRDTFERLTSASWAQAGASSPAPGYWQQDPSALSWVGSDDSSGYYRYDVAGNGSSYSVLRRVNHDKWGDAFTSREKRFIYRVGFNTTSNAVQLSFGIARSASVLQPSDSYIFLFDSGVYTNLVVGERSGGSFVATTSTGLTLSSLNQTFHEFELRCTSTYVHVYVDGTYLTDLGATSATSTNKYMSPFFGIYGTGTTYRGLVIDDFEYLQGPQP